MATITIHVGQCGLQLAHKFYNQIFHESQNVFALERSQAILDSFFDSNNNNNNMFYSRSVLVDMEPRVIEKQMCDTQQNLKANSNSQASFCWNYPHNSTIMKPTGSANNWAVGYYQHGPENHHIISEVIQAQLEKAENSRAFLIFRSVAGGTGSGLGSYIEELLKDLSPKSLLFNISVWPLTGGEINVQGYNSILSLYTTYRESDGIFFLENERYASLSKYLEGDKSKFELTQINTHMATALAGCLMPQCYKSTTGTLVESMPYIYSSLCSHPVYKLISLRSLPQYSLKNIEFCEDNFKGLIRRLFLMLKNLTIIDLECSKPLDIGHNDLKLRNLYSYFLSLLLKQKATQEFSKDFRNPEIIYNTELKGLLKIYAEEKHRNEIFASLPKVSQNLKLSVNNPPLKDLKKSLYLASNCQTPLFTLSMVLEKTKRLYQYNTYYHQFESQGLERIDIESAILQATEVIGSYSKINCH